MGFHMLRNISVESRSIRTTGHSTGKRFNVFMYGIDVFFQTSLIGHSFAALRPRTHVIAASLVTRFVSSHRMWNSSAIFTARPLTLQYSAYLMDLCLMQVQAHLLHEPSAALVHITGISSFSGVHPLVSVQLTGITNAELTSGPIALISIPLQMNLQDMSSQVMLSIELLVTSRFITCKGKIFVVQRLMLFQHITVFETGLTSDVIASERPIDVVIALHMQNQFVFGLQCGVTVLAEVVSIAKMSRYVYSQIAGFACLVFTA